MGEHDQLKAGQKVGADRFLLQQFLGKGGMGVVWLAQDLRLDEAAALKFLPADVCADATALEDLRRETRKTRQLTHPNIVRIHDIFEVAREAPFIAMEHVGGGNLHELARQNPQHVLSWEFLAPLVEELCAALEYAHGQKVIHRDLKPANLMLDGAGHLKLADFGIAATVSESRSRVSLRHATSGTVTHMSPQQMNGETPCVADDIYSLGATLYELLTGRPPFYRGDIGHQVQNVPATPLEDRQAELEIQNPVPAAVSAMILACLAKDPEQRPPNARAVAEWSRDNRIERAATACEQGASPAMDLHQPHEPVASEGGDSPGTDRSRRRIWLRLAMTVLLILGLGTLGYLIFGRFPTAIRLVPPTTLDLIAYWPFDGSAQDESGHGHHGVVSNAVLAVDRFGRTGRAYRFNGTNSYIRVPHQESLNLAGDFTITLWLRQSRARIARLLDKKTAQEGGGPDHDGWIVDTRNDGVSRGGSRFRLAGGAPLQTVLSDNELPLNEWHQIVVRLSGQTCDLFLDGEPCGSGHYGRNPTNTLDLYIGRAHSTPLAPKWWVFEGDLDDVRIHGRALSAKEVSSQYQRERLPQTAGATLDESDL